MQCAQKPDGCGDSLIEFGAPPAHQCQGWIYCGFSAVDTALERNIFRNRREHSLGGHINSYENLSI